MVVKVVVTFWIFEKYLGLNTPLRMVVKVVVTFWIFEKYLG